MTKKQIKQKLKENGISVIRLKKIHNWAGGERYIGTFMFKRYLIYIQGEEIANVYENQGNKKIKIY